MGDGCVALILDTTGLAQRARVLSEGRKPAGGGESLETRGIASDWQTLLVVRSPGNGRLAIPLSRVARLEEFDPAQVESAGDIDVIQYREQILPLISLQDMLSERRNANRLTLAEANLPQADLLQVVVFGNAGRAIGLVVNEFIDVSEEILKIKGQASRAGVLGTAVIHGRVTELFDVEAFLKRALPLLTDTVEA